MVLDYQKITHPKTPLGSNWAGETRALYRLALQRMKDHSWRLQNLVQTESLLAPPSLPDLPCSASPE